MKLYSKAQLGTIEMIMVLLVVIILIVIGIVFYSKFFLKSIEEKGEALTQQKIDVLLASLASMPELQCSFRTSDRNCIDMSKVVALKDHIDNYKSYYTDLFGFKNIKIELLYPKENDAICDITKSRDLNYPNNCNLWIIYNNIISGEKAIVSTPISMYFPNTKEYRVGKLIIEVSL